MNIIKSENRNLISAKELYSELGIKRDYSNWIKQSIERAELEVNEDFTTFKAESTGGRPTIDYLLVRDAALTVIMMSGGQFASRLRKNVIGNIAHSTCCTPLFVIIFSYHMFCNKKILSLFKLKTIKI